jgi:hypothetical protein
LDVADEVDEMVNHRVMLENFEGPPVSGGPSLFRSISLQHPGA